MKKFDFIIIGASKCGTTSVWEVLSKHPKIKMSKEKEPYIFSFNNWRDRLEQKGLDDDSYVRGEASPIYAETVNQPEVPERIFEHNSKTKIIFIVREPFERMLSVWRQTRSTGHHYQPKYLEKTDKAVPLMPQHFEEAIFSYPAYLNACRYKAIYEKYTEYFGEENILVCFFDELRIAPNDLYSRIYSFLSIEQSGYESLWRLQANSGENKVEARPLLIKTRRIAARLALNRMIPPVIKTRISTKLEKTISKPQYTKELADRIRAELRDDVRFIENFKPVTCNNWAYWK